MYNYEYRVVVLDPVMSTATKHFSRTSAVADYKAMKEQYPDAFVTIEMREAW